MPDLPGPPKSVCILRLSAIGDCCHVVPVVRSLQAAWPSTAFTWVIGQVEASLLGDIPGIEFLVYDKRRRRINGQPLRHALAPRSFDVLLHMQASWRANLLAWQIQAPIKLGFDRARAREAQWLFTNRRIAPASRSHVIEGMLGFATALGVRPRELRWDIPLSAADLRFAAQQLAEPRRALVISPCSSARRRNFRNWRLERYAAVARYAMQRHGLQVLITGGRSAVEQQYGSGIAGAVPGVVNLVGQTSLKQLLALLARSRAVLCPDSGPAHMATAVGTPVIGLYASSNPRRSGPLDLRWTVNRYEEAVRAEFGVAPHQLRWGQRVRDPQVMDRITVDDVIAKLDELMAAGPSGPTAQLPAFPLRSGSAE